MKKVALAAGTRPEVIKLAPVFWKLELSPSFEAEFISSGQQRELSAQAFEIFDIKPGIDLALMEENQTPEDFLSKAIKFFSAVFKARNIEAVVVQGDTTTALAAAISAFHLKLPIAHVEAGLRTGDNGSPFPEEMNRSLISKLTSLNFCPTQGAAKNLKSEGVDNKVFVTGNTVVDSALWCREALSESRFEAQGCVPKESPFILVTCHRRENFDGPLDLLCDTLLELGDKIEGVRIVFPIHLNPNVKDKVESKLDQAKNVDLVPPQAYPQMIDLVSNARLIITDSGGLQEEAPSFGTPLIVTRESTERPEAIEAGVAELVPLSNRKELMDKITSLLEQGDRPKIANPFGDGQAATRIVNLLENHWGEA